MSSPVRSVARALLARSPGSIRRGVRGIREIRAKRGAHERPSSPPRQIDFPPDVANKDHVRAFLLDTPYGAEVQAEMEAYLSDAIDRFRVTMALVPDVEAGGKVLELGAGPYYLTRLLRRRGLDVTCANFFGPEVGPSGTDMLERSADGGLVMVEYDNFNVETDRFPYPDGSFDLVLCCEILEHLPADPVRMLAEIHRVLRKDTGQLLLTTPNAARMMNLVRMLSGENVYEQFSGYGAYGRHNREYTVAELDRLLTEAGYRVDDLFAYDVHANQQTEAPSITGADFSDRGDNLFALATAVGQPRWPYHDWLYASQHGIERRVVAPDVVMGENGYLQSSGLHSVEQMGGSGGTWISWTGQAERATLTLAPTFSGPADLVVEGISAPGVAGDSLTLYAAINGTEASWQIASGGDHFRVSTPVDVVDGSQRVEIWTDRTWVPAEVGAGGDRRRLGVALAAVRLSQGAPPSS